MQTSKGLLAICSVVTGQTEGATGTSVTKLTGNMVTLIHVESQRVGLMVAVGNRGPVRFSTGAVGGVLASMAPAASIGRARRDDSFLSILRAAVRQDSTS